MVPVMVTVLYVVEGPKTDLGRPKASAMMPRGWGVLAVPTGIGTVEIGDQRRWGGGLSVGDSCATFAVLGRNAS